MRYNISWFFLYFFALFPVYFTDAGAITQNSQKTLVKTRAKNINAEKYLPSASKLTRAASDRFYISSAFSNIATPALQSSFITSTITTTPVVTAAVAKSLEVQVQCSSGQYLPAKSMSCATCDTRYYCPGGTFSYSLVEQGRRVIKVNCARGQYLPANMSTCTSCKDRYYCPGGTFSVSTLDQGLVGTNSYSCLAGTYLPKNSVKCTACKNDNNHVCAGGTFEFSTQKDQGISKCPTGTFVAKNASTCGFSRDMLKYGMSGAGTSLTHQCWTQSKLEDYIKCITNK